MTKIKFFKGAVSYREPHPRSNMIPPSKRVMVFSLRFLTESEHKILDAIWQKHKSLHRFHAYKNQERKNND